MMVSLHTDSAQPAAGARWKPRIIRMNEDELLSFACPAELSIEHAAGECFAIGSPSRRSDNKNQVRVREA